MTLTSQLIALWMKLLSVSTTRYLSDPKEWQTTSTQDQNDDEDDAPEEAPVDPSVTVAALASSTTYPAQNTQFCEGITSKNNMNKDKAE